MLLSDLQNFLSGLQASNDGNATGRTVDLASAINAEALDKINTEAEQSEYAMHDQWTLNNHIQFNV